MATSVASSIQALLSSFDSRASQAMRDAGLPRSSRIPQTVRAGLVTAPISTVLSMFKPKISLAREALAEFWKLPGASAAMLPANLTSALPSGLSAADRAVIEDLRTVGAVTSLMSNAVTAPLFSLALGNTLVKRGKWTPAKFNSYVVSVASKVSGVAKAAWTVASDAAKKAQGAASQKAADDAKKASDLAKQAAAAVQNAGQNAGKTASNMAKSLFGGLGSSYFQGLGELGAGDIDPAEDTALQDADLGTEGEVTEDSGSTLAPQVLALVTELLRQLPAILAAAQGAATTVNTTVASTAGQIKPPGSAPSMPPPPPGPGSQTTQSTPGPTVQETSGAGGFLAMAGLAAVVLLLSRGK